jgi:hypothetical protein
MSQSSQSGILALGLQGAKGTAVPVTRQVRTRGGSLGGDRTLLIPDPEVGGNRDIPQAYLGGVAFSGDIDFYPRAQMIAMLLFGALGARSSTSVTGPPLIGTHVITPADTLPWFTAQERLGVDLETFQYTDVRVNSLRMEADANGYLTGSASLIGLTGVADATLTTNVPQDLSPLTVGSSVTFSFGGNDLRAKSFSFEIMNNMETDDFHLGSLFIGDAVPKRREVKMGATIRPEDSALWKAAMHGATNASTPQGGPAFRGAAQITISSYETIGNAIGGTPFSVTINVPVAVIAPFKNNPQGDDVIQNDIEITAIRPANATPLLTATVVNDLATIS